ncbi:MAG: lysylphosphatidylglycerol synthase transmembrane domain-containing protein [Proteobacteria bacterium]|nr:lysylphosphatidylglycerol synthase transmembrane domain-containing protein [Pseudomonadota bacterium]
MTLRHVLLAAKLAVSAGLVWWLVDHVDIGPLAARFARLDSGWAGLAVLALLAQFLVAALRWRLVTAAIGAPLSVRSALRFFMIGAFFNQTLPSSIGGDAFRVWYAHRDGRGLSEAFSGVFVDRLSALFVIVLVMVASLPWLFALLTDPVARWSMAVVMVGGSAAFAALFALPLSSFGIFERWAATRLIVIVVRDARRALIGRQVGLAVGAASLVLLVLSALVLYLAGRAIGVDLGLVHCLLLMPPIVAISVLPISLAGWGLREGAAVVGFGFAGIAQADALAASLLFGLLLAAVSLPGGVLWLMSGRRIRPDEQTRGSSP